MSQNTTDRKEPQKRRRVTLVGLIDEKSMKHHVMRQDAFRKAFWNTRKGVGFRTGWTHSRYSKAIRLEFDKFVDAKVAAGELRPEFRNLASL